MYAIYCYPDIYSLTAFVNEKISHFSDAVFNDERMAS
jgi:hypothetical protein